MTKSEAHDHFRVLYRDKESKPLESSEGAASFSIYEASGPAYRYLPEVWLAYPRYSGLIKMLDTVTKDAFDAGADELKGQLRYLLGVDDEIEAAVKMHGDPTAS